jgi:hypothetical protein
MSELCIENSSLSRGQAPAAEDVEALKKRAFTSAADLAKRL